MDGTYELADTESLNGLIGTNATAVPKAFSGFTLDATIEGTKQSGEITADGQQILKLYYTRNSYTLTLVAGENIEGVSGVGTYKHGEIVNIDAVIKDIDGYTVEFTKWYSSNPEKIADLIGKTSNFNMPQANITLTASAHKIINSYNYSIEYYYDGIKDEAKLKLH